VLNKTRVLLTEVRELTHLINKQVDELSFEKCSSLLAKRLGLLELIKSNILAQEHKDSPILAEFKETLLWLQQQDIPRLKLAEEQRGLCLQEIQKQAKNKKAVVAYNSI